MSDKQIALAILVAACVGYLVGRLVRYPRCLRDGVRIECLRARAEREAQNGENLL